MERTTKEQATFDRQHLTAMLESGHGGQPKLWFKLMTTGNGQEPIRYYQVFILRHACIVNVTPYAARIGGYRFDTRRFYLAVTGHGFNGAQDIAESIGAELFNDRNAVSYEEF